MVTITKSILINRPASEVFSFVSDYRNDIQWRQGVLAMRQEPDSVTSGQTKTFETIKFLGKKLIVKAYVISFKPDDQVHFKTTVSPIKTEGYRKVVPLYNGTEFTYSLSVELNGFYKLFSSSVYIQVQTYPV